MTTNKNNITELNDVLHLYLGCECKGYYILDDKTLEYQCDGTLKSVNKYYKEGENPWPIIIRQVRHNYWIDNHFNFDAVVPILRRIEDITTDEAWELIFKIPFYQDKHIKITKIERGNIYFEVQYNNLRWWPKTIPIKGTTPDQFLFLLNKQFDLFGLIDNKLAIDKSTL